MRRHVLVLLISVGTAAATAAPGAAASPTTDGAPSTVWVSVGNAGQQGDSMSVLGGEWGDPNQLKEAMSADGRFVAFTSYATDLVPGDTNGVEDAFVRDTVSGTTTRVNVSSNGAQDNSRLGSGFVSLSANGRFAAFLSAGTNLVPGATLGLQNVYVHDLRTGETVDASVSINGQPANGSSFDPVISADGRYVAFSTAATNFEAAMPGAEEIYVRDLVAGTTSLVSTSSDGVPADRSATASTFANSMSADGRFVAFSTDANNLVPNDTNADDDVFVHDTATGTTQRVSVSSTGAQANSDSFGGSLSADATKVVFSSFASNLVPRDRNGDPDVFLHDLTTGQTTLVSRSVTGSQGNDGSGAGVLSADGRHVAFLSGASNLVAGDRNGAQDVFVRDLGRHTTEQVDVSSDGAEPALGSARDNLSISAHGRRVAFDSDDSHLVPDDTNSQEDVFERYRG